MASYKKNCVMAVEVVWLSLFSIDAKRNASTPTRLEKAIPARRRSMLFRKSTDRRWMDRPTHEVDAKSKWLPTGRIWCSFMPAGRNAQKRNTHLLQHPDVDATAKGVSTRNASAAQEAQGISFSAQRSTGTSISSSTSTCSSSALVSTGTGTSKSHAGPSALLVDFESRRSAEEETIAEATTPSSSVTVATCGSSTDLSAAAPPQSTRRILNATPVGRRKGKKQPPPIYTPVKVNRLELNLAYIDASEFCVEQAYKRAGESKKKKKRRELAAKAAGEASGHGAPRARG